MQVILDADCLIAGTLADHGACCEILDRWQAGEFEITTCPQLLGEVGKTLSHPRITRKYAITGYEVSRLLVKLQEEANFVSDPQHPPRVVIHDPLDDYLVALAISIRAEALVTRDRHFESVRIEDLEILSSRQFINRLS